MWLLLIKYIKAEMEIGCLVCQDTLGAGPMVYILHKVTLYLATIYLTAGQVMVTQLKAVVEETTES